MEEKTTAFLEVKDLVVEYSSGDDVVHAVNGVSFSLERGKTLALVGETGAGKTTIAKTIMRILPDPPARVRGGRILLNGKNLLEMHETEMRKVRGGNISMVFQDPMTALNPVMKIGNQIAEVIKVHNGITKKEAAERAAEMLEMVGITRERYNEYPHQFSGGMKQRVIIAIALACSPELLLADEPTTALDVTIQAQVLEMINELRKKYNTSMIMITHDLGVVAKVSDEVAIVYAGKIIEQGSKEEIFEHPTHPYTRGLFGAIPNIKADVRRLSNIEGLPPDPTHLPAGCSFHPRCPYATEECQKDSVPMKKVGESHFCSCLHIHAPKKEVPYA
ncbi:MULTISPECIES: ABC transporter ATP-binding protein [Hungatella]|uniref:ATP-binding cassette domain-containing protein n=1 Tax=Hungatella hathewayi TaxID=154046 RepID=A0AAW9WP83_9FIRM|nr:MULTISPECIES: ABC transporter ATP-binding protein [Hungatella]MCQ4833076.1 ABC transporter ATP-binding protein [Hungatella sp. SL.1.14]MCQ5387363.1 ABC transporter ATP-binding protein [Hungatella hathewayi]MUB67130.1 ATP-binding cassette domain-containing protein [Hungatella hathewayi]CUQ59928.1 oligopeptide/dipeptide ABC transporter%2C ATP-binding protein%2C C-terminal domain [Hungatella hathewayi]